MLTSPLRPSAKEDRQGWEECQSRVVICFYPLLLSKYFRPVRDCLGVIATGSRIHNGLVCFFGLYIKVPVLFFTAYGHD